MDDKLAKAISTIRDILNNQKLTIKEHEIVQNAFQTILKGLTDGNNGVYVQRTEDEGS